MSDNPPGRRVRLRTASDKKKAFQQYDELRRSGRVARALVLAEMHDDSLQILGQGMSLTEIAGVLLAGAKAVAHAGEEQNKPKFEPHQEPMSVGEHSQGTIPKRAITLDSEGIMVPPSGETIISCGICHHPRWYVLMREADEQPSRFSCAACGNEIVLHQTHHSGTA